MPKIAGLHHIAVAAKDAQRSGEWYERVFGFTRLLVEEEEDRVTDVMLEHPLPELNPASVDPPAGVRRA